MPEREPSILRSQPHGVAAAEPRRPSAGPGLLPVPPEISGQARIGTAPNSGRTGHSAPRRAPDSGRGAPVFYAAGFWRRVGAAMIDLAVIIPVALVLAWVSGKITGVHLPPSRHYGVDFWLDLLLASDPALFGLFGLTLGTAAVYALVFQITWTCTPGMRISSIHIIDSYGDAPSIVRFVARTGGYLLAVATLGLGFLWIGFDSERRGLHDWLSGTYVVKS